MGRAPGDLGRRAPFDGREGRLQAVDMADRLGRLELSEVVVAQADGPSLALVDQFEEAPQYSSIGVPSSAGQCIW